MDYITSKVAAERCGMTERRIQQLCKEGKISGAIKQGRSWLVPADAFIQESAEIQKKQPLPIGISDFKKATTEYYYVDKTLLIRDFLDSKPQVSLFTRPRRFGKTLTMDMLRVFFEKTEEDTSVYFRDKKIWQCGEKYTQYQGQYPVVFLSFKDVKCSSWEDTYGVISKLVSSEFQRHVELFDSEKLTDYEKNQYKAISECKAEQVDYRMALQTLSLMLYKHYGKECIIIIDEYDTPIQQGHTCGFYDQIIDFMRNFFSCGLKDNKYLRYGFLTGILHVAKESIFSGLNNLKISSILDESYSEYFGFTANEVKEMLDYYNYQAKFDEVCEWYDGYMFGNTEIFNPWSVINYVSDKCFPKAYWQATGSNDIIGEIISVATPEITQNLHALLSGEKVATYIDTSVIYPEITDNPYSIYSFLLIAGYLKVADVYPQNDGNYMCNVAIPNKEISFVYEKEILSKTGRESIAISVQQAIFSKDFQRLRKLLENFMLESISSFDGADEKFYHGMMLGLCAIVNNRYKVRSNRESGIGRFDIALFPKIKSLPGFIFEFKHTKNESDDLDDLAQRAVDQIIEKKYDSEIVSSGVAEIHKIGIAFRGKTASIKVYENA